MSALIEPFDTAKLVDDEHSTDRIDAAGFAASACIKRVKSGETLHLEGDPAPYCYQVASGFIKEYNTLEDGRRQITDFYGVGEMFGITDIDRHLHTAEAISDSVVRYYPREMLSRACSSPILSRYFFDTLVARLNRSHERIIMLGRMNAAQRVAVFLFHLSEKGAADEEIDLPMSRQDIADHLGLTTETVCRSLTDLKRKGYISMSSARRFSVCDTLRLGDVARGASGML